MAKYNKRTGLFTFHGGETFDETYTDEDGYWHRMFTTENGLVGHDSNRPYCFQCNYGMDIQKTEHSYTEICPNCGQGNGSMWC